MQGRIGVMRPSFPIDLQYALYSFVESDFCLQIFVSKISSRTHKLLGFVWSTKGGKKTMKATKKL